MIRFRNPISDMNILIENFKKMYSEFSNLDYFELDDIAEFFARERLASSSGYVGKEALKRSYSKKEDSKKPLKMQSKSYAELFRILGWITSGKKALEFNFTYLGVHIAKYGRASKLLFEQCLLGIEYPNNILDVKFEDKNKPFVSILLFADELDGKICRDEMILGPMNLLNGYSEFEKVEKISYLKDIRKKRSIKLLHDEIEKLAHSNSMKSNSLRNLTRFPISALEYTGWFEKKQLSLYGRKMPFLVLTEKGRQIVEQIKNSLILKGGDIVPTDEDGVKIAELSLLCMFRRANFDVKEEIKDYELTFEKLCRKHDTLDIIFSPYQYFSGVELKTVLPKYTLKSRNDEHRAIEVETDTNLITIRSEVKVEATKSALSENEQLKKELSERLNNERGDVEQATQRFLKDIEDQKQSDFYPLVANLLGFIFNKKAFAPSAGNNNMRFDVIIPDDHYSIPVEVKSPTEEEMLSVKAIRQAVENKVVLMARKPYNTIFEVSSFACGFKLPHDRSDVYKLIDEVYETFKINVSILDMATLITGAFRCVQRNKYYEISDFIGKRGVIKL